MALATPVASSESPYYRRGTMSSRETRIRRRIAAPRSVVYDLLLDPAALPAWKVPDGMTCEVHHFEAREGGRFRVSLSYDEPGHLGKSSTRTDTYHGEFVRLVPEAEVVERMEFETTDPAMQGTMTATYRLSAVPEGTDLLAIHTDVPPGVTLADNEAGWSMSLDKLAAVAEARGR